MNEHQAEAWAALTELVRELSWGIDLPGVPFDFVVKGGEIERHVIHPEETKPMFDVIYNKMKTYPEYQPFTRAARQALVAQTEVFDAVTIIQDLLSEIESTESEAKTTALAWLHKWERSHSYD